MRESKLDWGPKPLCSLNGWVSVKGFDDFVKEKWESRVIVNISYSCQMERKKQLWGEL